MISTPQVAARDLVVLIIDDDPDALRLLELHLKCADGLKVQAHTFTDWRAALGEMPSVEPDLVILDHHLQDVTGVQVYGMMMESGDAPPAILATGMAEESIVRDSFLGGFADYIPKTKITSESLGRAIENVMHKHRMGQEIKRHELRQKELIRTLQRRNEEIESFYHSLSHELKTPLTAIREFASILQDGLQGPLSDGQQTSVQTISRAADRMTLNINDMLDMTRIETGKLRLDVRAVSVEPMLLAAIDECVAAAEAAGVALGIDGVVSAVPTALDSHRVVQVLVNLIQNSIKFTNEGGSICLRAELAPDGEWMEVSVEDDGRGVRPGDLHHIFERHFQSSDGDAAQHGGLGLGLHICRQIVQLHGGDIGAKSEWGAGTTVCFSLPLAAR